MTIDFFFFTPTTNKFSFFKKFLSHYVSPFFVFGIKGLLRIIRRWVVFLGCLLILFIGCSKMTLSKRQQPQKCNCNHLASRVCYIGVRILRVCITNFTSIDIMELIRRLVLHNAWKPIISVHALIFGSQWNYYLIFVFYFLSINFQERGKYYQALFWLVDWWKVRAKIYCKLALRMLFTDEGNPILNRWNYLKWWFSHHPLFILSFLTHGTMNVGKIRYSYFKSKIRSFNFNFRILSYGKKWHWDTVRLFFFLRFSIDQDKEQFFMIIW